MDTQAPMGPPPPVKLAATHLAAAASPPSGRLQHTSHAVSAAAAAAAAAVFLPGTRGRHYVIHMDGDADGYGLVAGVDFPKECESLEDAAVVVSEWFGFGTLRTDSAESWIVK